MMTTTTVMTRESRRRRRQTVINDATAYKKTKGGVQTSARSKRTGREREEEEEEEKRLCRFAKRRRDASIFVAIFFVWCVFCGVRANEQKEKLLKKIRERERERTPTNQPSDAILYLFAKTSKFVPFLSRDVLHS